MIRIECNDKGTQQVIIEDTRRGRTPVIFQERVVVPITEAVKVKAAIRNDNGTLRIPRYLLT